jgi:uncharacterized protein (TIGR03084 family)
MPDDTLDPLLDDLAAEQDALDAVVGARDHDEWETPTPAPGWAVRQQVAHITYFDEQAALAVTDAAAFEAGRDAMFADLEAVDTAGPYAALPVPDLMARWRAGRAALRVAFAGVDPKARLPWYGPSMSARSALTARLMECWAHGVDVTDAFALPPSASNRLRHVAHLGVVTRGWSYVVHGMEAPADPVAVVLAPPGGGEPWLWGDETAADRVEGPALDFCLVVTQRRHVDDTAVVADGPLAEDWMRIAQAFAGPPGAGREPGQFK